MFFYHNLKYISVPVQPVLLIQSTSLHHHHPNLLLCRCNISILSCFYLQIMSLWLPYFLYICTNAFILGSIFNMRIICNNKILSKIIPFQLSCPTLKSSGNLMVVRRVMRVSWWLFLSFPPKYLLKRIWKYWKYCSGCKCSQIHVKAQKYFQKKKKFWRRKRQERFPNASFQS